MGTTKPKASPSFLSATTQVHSNYIFRLIKCGCLLIEFRSMCSISFSIELELLRRVLTQRGMFVVVTNSGGNTDLVKHRWNGANLQLVSIVSLPVNQTSA